MLERLKELDVEKVKRMSPEEIVKLIHDEIERAESETRGTILGDPEIRKIMLNIQHKINTLRAKLEHMKVAEQLGPEITPEEEERINWNRVVLISEMIALDLREEVLRRKEMEMIRKMREMREGKTESEMGEGAQG